MGKKKGDIKDNPNWCKNPQYFLSLNQPTMLKIILRKTGTKNSKVGKLEQQYVDTLEYNKNKFKKGEKKDKNIGNLQRLLQQTSQFL
jgi:calpain